MPFTAAHPAIVLPLKQFQKRWFSLTGLVTGSIAPDFGYFLSFLFEIRISSHDLRDIYTFNLPVTILLAVLFHGFVRDNSIKYLPPFLKKKALPAKGVHWFRYLRQHWFIFLLSATIGILSHLFWDSFTHYDGYFVSKVPWLLKPVEAFGITLPISRVIQHASTLVGLIVILLYVLFLPSYPVTASHNWAGYWALVLIGGLLMLLAYTPEVVIMKTLDELVVRFITGCLVAMLLFGLLSKLKLRMTSS
ncbi:DUF4184 family protein [Pontibacter locisalis]|uniref:DUF4184 family protein n=1 Tax=Pontibacter locisalis TaxID=1719035 RepID=A0ABW5IL75_9BACT